MEIRTIIKFSKEDKEEMKKAKISQKEMRQELSYNEMRLYDIFDDLIARLKNE